MKADEQPQVILASASARRAELLTQIGVRFEMVQIDVDERPQEGEPASSLALRLALAKAEAGFRLTGTGRPVLGADTVVALGAQIYGKPVDETDAACTLRSLSGRWHEVTTAVCVLTRRWQRCLCARSQVRFRHLRRDEIRRYCASGEPFGKAGAYAVQGLAAMFIEEIRGSYSGVMGLPLYETARLLTEAGVAPLAGFSVDSS